MKIRKNAIFWQIREGSGRMRYNLSIPMSSPFEKFTSDVRQDTKVWEDTRVNELRNAWMEAHPGEPYPESNGVGETVWSRDQLQDKGDKKTDAQIREEWEEKARRALEIAQANAREETASRPGWYPPEALMAWWVPDASEVASSWAPTVSESTSESPV
jgi:hypothetical protein